MLFRSQIPEDNSCEVFMQVDCEMITCLALTLWRCCHHFVLFIREKYYFPRVEIGPLGFQKWSIQGIFSVAEHQNYSKKCNTFSFT